MNTKVACSTVVLLIALIACGQAQVTEVAYQTPNIQPSPASTATALPVPTPLGGGPGQFAFQATVNGQTDIYVMDVATQQITNLTNDAAQEDAFRWSPDGTRLVYRTREKHETGQPSSTPTWIINADGSNKYLLHECPIGCGLADWAADGQTLCMMVISNREPLKVEIDIVQANRSDMHRVTPRLDFIGDQKWSPNNQYIGYDPKESKSAHTDLAITDTNGAIQILTTTPDDDEYFIGWSPDSTKILFVVEEQPGEFSTRVMDVATKNIVATLPFPDYWTNMRWLENGQILVAGETSIYSMQSDGANMESIFETPWKISVAAFSPDATYFILGKFENPDPNAVFSLTKEVYLAGLDGSFIPLINPEILLDLEDVEWIAWRP